MTSERGDRKVRAVRLRGRFFAGSLLIVSSVAAATALSILLYLTDIAQSLEGHRIRHVPVMPVEGGAPQTILIIGSDKRQGPAGKGDPGRSDTTILLRVDPDRDRIALLSIPRDLRVNVPGVGRTKFNEAYASGRERKTLRVVRRLTGLDINHVVNVNFTGFADAVDAIGGVYVDVDRRYFIGEDTGTSAIDVDAGYQLMQGYKALQYVRFRHFDNDIVRSARQQDFMREARQKLPADALLRDRNELMKVFTDYTTSDIDNATELVGLLKTLLGVRSATVREVHFPAKFGETYVTADTAAIKEAVAQFLGTDPAQPEPKPNHQAPSKGKPKKPDPDHFVGPTMEDSTDQAQASATQLSHVRRKDGDPMLDFPVYYPTRLVPGSTIVRDSRAFPIDGPGGDVYHGYKQVIEIPGGEVFDDGLLEEYYGVSGTDWIDAPILANPSETRTIDGNQYLLFYDSGRLRTVGWKTSRAAYWINNSLLQSLDEDQMLSIATSMRKLD